MPDQLSLFTSPGDELTRLRAENARLRAEGCKCPVCDQFCKVYKYKVDSGMAASLCWLVSNCESDGSVLVNEDAPRFALRSNKISRLRKWGLVSQPPCKDPARRTSGRWTPTPTGIAFARGESSICKYVYLYNNEILNFSVGETVTIQEALGDKFNYAELMSGLTGEGNE